MLPLQSLKARYVFPVAAEPIRDGIVTIQGPRIVAVGRQPAAGDVRDLGNVAILPGLINAHTHLEFSDIDRPLGHAGIGFVPWVERVMTSRQQRVEAAGPAVEVGLRESVRQGVTGLGEIARPEWPPAVFERARLATTIFLELIAPTAARLDTALGLARQHLRPVEPGSAWRPGLSPHAPYSVRPEALSAIVSLSAQERVPLAFHLAESREELELLDSGTGPLRVFLERLGAWDPHAFPSRLRPMDYLRTLSAAHRALVIHGNYLDDEETQFLAHHADRMAVVFCPRTHDWFDHADYPLEKYLAAGVRVALGTDSRASSPDLSILAELRRVADKSPALAPAAVLRLATIDAAGSLGWDRETGSLQPGKHANLTVVALPDHEPADAHELLFDSDKPVVGRWYLGEEDKAGGG